MSIFEVGNYLIGLVANVKTHPGHLRKGLAASFFELFAAVLRRELKSGHDDAFMVVQQDKELNPHGFYKRIGFVDAPPMFESWKIESSDLAVRRVTEDDDEEVASSVKELI